MIDEQKLREKLANLWKRKIPVAPSSFRQADELIDEVIEAATVPEPTTTPSLLEEGE